MEVTPHKRQQKLLVLLIPTAKESMTQVAMTVARSLCVQIQLLMQQVQEVVSMRKTHLQPVMALIFLFKLLDL